MPSLVGSGVGLGRRILSPADGTQLDGPEATVAYGLRSSSGKPVRAVRVLADGRPIADGRGLGREEPGGAQETRGQVTVPIPADRTVEIVVQAETDTRVSEPARIRLRGAPGAMLPDLHAVVVGASLYRDQGLRRGVNLARGVGLAAKVARDLAAALTEERGRGLFRDTHVRIVTNADATRADVLDGLDWLRRGARNGDVAIPFLAGHGVQEDGTVFFLPVDGDPDRVIATGVAQTELHRVLAGIPGRVVGFVDICHTGGAVLAIRGLPDMAALAAQLREPGSGLIVFSATTRREQAFEVPELGNFAFSRALLEGLRNGADYNHDGVVRTDKLNTFVATRVRELTGGRQHPVMQRPGDVPNFPLFVVKP